MCIFSPDILQAGAVKGLIVHQQLPVFTCEFVLSSALIVAVLNSCCYDSVWSTSPCGMNETLLN